MTKRKEKPIINCKFIDCRKEFKQSRKDKIYCSARCRRLDWEQQTNFNKSLGN